MHTAKSLKGKKKITVFYFHTIKNKNIVAPSRELDVAVTLPVSGD